MPEPPDVPAGYVARWPALVLSALCAVFGIAASVGVLALGAVHLKNHQPASSGVVASGSQEMPPSYLGLAGGFLLAGFGSAAAIWKRDIDQQVAERLQEPNS